MNRKLCTFVIFLILFLLPFSPLFAYSIEKQWDDYWQDADKKLVNGNYPYQSCFEQAAVDQDLPVSLLIAVARGESDFNPKAVSKSNALGIMQILWPGTAKDLGFTTKNEVFQPCPNIKAGAKYLGWLLERYQNNPHKALAAYNYGPGRISTDNKHIPAGAIEYSEYIYSHLEKVIGQSSATVASGKLALLEFNRLFRAKAFVSHLQKQHPDLHLEWFRGKHKNYAVVVTYSSQAQRNKDIKVLKKYGFLTF